MPIQTWCSLQSRLRDWSKGTTGRRLTNPQQPLHEHGRRLYVSLVTSTAVRHGENWLAQEGGGHSSPPKEGGGSGKGALVTGQS